MKVTVFPGRISYSAIARMASKYRFLGSISYAAHEGEVAL